MITKIICDDSILIVPSNIKNLIIKEITSLDSFFSCKIISDKELKKLVFFDYDIKAIDKLASLLNINHSVAKEYIEAMYYINDNNYPSNKLNMLFNYKSLLLKDNLLKIDRLFINSLKNKKVIIYGFDIISKEMQLILKELTTDYSIISNKRKYEHNKQVYCFESLDDEVEAIAYQISSLIDEGVDINNIKIANVNQDYVFAINRIFKMYNIPINLHSSEKLFNLCCVKNFYNNFVKNNDFNKSLKEFSALYPLEAETFNCLVDICNQLVEVYDKQSALLYLLKNTSIPLNTFSNAVEIINIDNYLSNENDYIFVLSNNQNIFPKTYKDESFLTDKEKEMLKISTSDDLNKQSKESFKLMLGKHKNLILSYKLKSSFASYNKSFVLEELGFNEMVFNQNTFISYSSISDRLSLAKKLDNLYLKNQDVDLEAKYNFYKIPYKNYDHRFKSFDSNKIKDYLIKSKKSLSYSALDNFFKCSYRYYLNNILSIGKVPQNISIDIGNSFHKILELSFKEGFDFEKSFEEEIKKIQDIVTMFYLNKHKLALKEIININKDNLSQSQLDKVLTEQKVSINYSSPIPITFKGFIDKIIYTTKDDKTYVAIIDYKTGNPEIDVSKVKYGLSMQLPIYLYLLKHANELKNVVVCGFYLQKLIPKQASVGADYIDTLKDGIMLQGYSNSDKNVLSMLDPHYESSSMIKSMRVKKDGGFYPYTKVLSSEDMNEIASMVEEKVIDALNQICECNFKINPKVIEGKNIGCAFCEFADCCFYNHNDLCYLDSKTIDEEGE